MLTDAGALGLALFAAWISRQPARPGRTYGWLRAEILAALANAALLLAVTIGIIWEAIDRMFAPEQIHWQVMFWVALAGFVANLGSAFLLHRSRESNLNLKAAYLHVLSDLAGSAAAMLAAIVIKFTDWDRIDPLLSLGLSALLLVSSVRLLWQAVDVLLESAPRHLDMMALQSAMAQVPGVERGARPARVDGGQRDDRHERPLRGQRADAAARGTEEITRRVRGFGIGHVTVQLEQEGDCVGCDVK